MGPFHFGKRVLFLTRCATPATPASPLPWLLRRNKMTNREGEKKINLTGVIKLPTQTLREIPQNYHTFILFDSPQTGNSMTAV